ncbi:MULTISPECIES: GNAT family N-acetyltransferase [unclassified Streptomyces]|uniref:GNAT family N-acetyltransferase n=1 Tax=unclassified Streptomyces TaxID=2593676 RepID=UPI00068B8E5F|nr:MULTISPECIES: GNAT family N-acetyltransferase [unclassified Streptomyces]KOV92099.1 GCN5 family acetyltransferase [Streptomyces sp. NRRL WC-3723]
MPSPPNPQHRMRVEGSRIETERLVMRRWSANDAAGALAVYGEDDVSHWLAPAMATVPDRDAMEALLRQWIEECSSLEPPAGRWAIELAETGEIVGGAAILPLPPDGIDLEIGWQLARPFWGRGLATEAGHGAAHYAFTAGVDEVFAVVRPRNTRGMATARRVGMEWVGVTDKYYGLTLQIYRLREGDLDVPPLLENR